MEKLILDKPLIDQILLSREDAAKALSISVRKLDYLIASNEIVCRRVGRRTLVPVTALKAFARRDHFNQ